MNNFCTNCGAKIRKEDNFCTHCGTKIDKSYMVQNNHLNSASDTIEKKNAKKELKRVVGKRILYNKNFANELHIKSLDVINTGKAIRQQVEKEIDAGQIKIGGVEYRVNQLILEYKIKKQEENKKLKMLDELLFMKTKVMTVHYNISAAFVDVYRALCAKQGGHTNKDVVDKFGYKSRAFAVEKAFQKLGKPFPGMK